MSETSIAWTHYSFNPWWGCQRVSPGCEHCYSEAFAHRLGMDLWGPSAGRRFFDDRHWHQPVLWNRRREKGDPRHLVFCASMADTFEDDRRLDEQRARLWRLIEATPALTWQILTKRPENADKLTPGSWVLNGWPRNVWAMVTAEDQQRADERIPLLLRIPARVHGVSYEPALQAVDFRRWLSSDCDDCDGTGLEPGALVPCESCHGERRWRGVDWVVCGGESGPGARPFVVAWARSVIEQCREAGVACFVKQLGRHPQEIAHTAASDREAATWQQDGWTRIHDADGEQWRRYLRLKSAKGGDPAEWPEDLRVREYPRASQ